MSPLPKIGTKDWGNEVKLYQTAPLADINRRAKELGYANGESYGRAMRVRGIHRNKSLEGDCPPIPEVINLPKIHLLKYKAPKIKGDEEVAILHASDGHGGKITSSFNKSVYRSRMGKMFESAMTIVNLHRNMYPIRSLYIFNTGDNCQGENPYQGSKVGEVECGARDQIKTIVAPMWNDVLGSFSQEFESIYFKGVPGNHGTEKLAPSTSAEDLRLYDILESGISQQVKNISIEMPEGDKWYLIVNIFGFKFFLFHGDGIPCQQGVPFFALDKKLKSWYMQFGGFDYACGGHFHKRHSDAVSSRLEYMMAGSLVSDDNWALKKIGISSNPSQWIYGVHPRYGVTWRYPLTVDDKFLHGEPE